MDSIESLVRKTIQKQKIEMASEVIDAGRYGLFVRAGITERVAQV